MELATLLQAAIEGQITDRKIVEIRHIRVIITRDEIRVEVGKGEQKRVYIWQRFL